MNAVPRTLLNIERALAYVGDPSGIAPLLETLQQSLQSDLPRIRELLDAGDVPGVNRLLHQIKGFAPVFCGDDLVAEVVRVENLSKTGDAQTVRAAYQTLGPLLEQLLSEVQARTRMASIGR